VVEERAVFQLRGDLFAHLQTLSLLFHDRIHTGELLNRVSRDTERVIGGLLSSGGDVLTSVVKFVGVVATLMFLNVRLSLLAFAFMPVFAVAFTVLRRMTKISAKIARYEEGRLFTTAHEILTNIRIVKAFGRHADEKRRFDQHGITLMDAELRAERWDAGFGVLIDLIKATVVVAIVWYGVNQILAGNLTVGGLLVFLSYLGSVYSPLKKISQVVGSLQKAAISGDRVSELLDDPAVLTTPTNTTLPLALNGANPSAPVYHNGHSQNGTSLGRVSGRIEFERVCFGYDPSRIVLREMSFVVEPGQKIGVVGPTGAGKTTLISLLMRFYDPTSGRILVDGHELRSVHPSLWCRQVALVTQESFLFAATVQENIAYGRPEATMEEIVRAAQIANAHDFIMQLPNHYATVIGERGATLSGGQRQRLTLARAVLYDT
ncbi:MAG TPA: ABC transporter ATP-binding protein, partial [Caldilineaceae bacterium]|nr:ABC transporter ATP-binding protein [Caldilineaceae bacterium]